MHTHTLSELTERQQAARDAADFVRWGLSLATTRGLSSAVDDFEQRVGPRSSNAERIRALLKSATGAVTDPGLVRPLANEFLTLVSKRSAFDRIAAFSRRAALGTSIPLQSVGASMTWVGQGLGTPVVKGTFANASLPGFKIGGLTVLSMELARANDARSVGLITRDLARAAAVGTDTAAFSTAAASALVRPAGLLNGATEVAATADLEGDIVSLWASVSDGEAETPYYVVNGTVAMHLCARRNAGGVRLFPDVTALGGSIAGVPVLVGAGVPDMIILVDAAGVATADEGLELEQSSAPAIQMDDAPSQDGTAGTGSTMVSLWQSGLAALKTTRWLNWARRADAIAYRVVHLDSSPTF